MVCRLQSKRATRVSAVPILSPIHLPLSSLLPHHTSQHQPPFPCNPTPSVDKSCCHCSTLASPKEKPSIKVKRRGRVNEFPGQHMYVSHLLVLSGASSEKLQAFPAEPLVPGTPRTLSFCHSTHLYGPCEGCECLKADRNSPQRCLLSYNFSSTPSALAAPGWGNPPRSRPFRPWFPTASRGLFFPLAPLSFPPSFQTGPLLSFTPPLAPPARSFLRLCPSSHSAGPLLLPRQRHKEAESSRTRPTNGKVAK